MASIALRAVLALFCLLALHAAPLAAQTGQPDPAAQNKSGDGDEPPAPRQKAGAGHSDWAIAELVRIDEQMRQINEQLARIHSSTAVRGPLEEATRNLAELKESPALACGAPEEARASFVDSLRRTIASLRSVSVGMTTLYPWEELDLAALPAMCGPPLTALLTGMEEGVGSLNSQFGASAASRDDLDRALAELDERKRDVVTQMSNEVASARVAATMPWILVIIFSLGIVMMLGIRLFSPSIQSELVCSGQLVQFVTILILFGTLLALGLAEKLQEQTLGALLGGLAGYVLSQGIGQKERRSTLETIRSMRGPDPQPDPQAGPPPDSGGNGGSGGSGGQAGPTDPADQAPAPPGDQTGAAEPGAEPATR